MTPSPESLRVHYAELDDAALLHLADRRDSLTPQAQDILSQELKERGLTPPDVVQELHPDLANSPVWVTVERFRDLSSAIVARGALEAADIPCFLRDENTVRLDWQISNFIGGMRLQVQDQDASAALAVLRQTSPSETQNGPSELDGEERCPFCGSTDVHRVERGLGLRAAALWMFSIPLPRGPREWHCRHCGRQFAESELLLPPTP